MSGSVASTVATEVGQVSIELQELVGTVNDTQQVLEYRQPVWQNRWDGDENGCPPAESYWRHSCGVESVCILYFARVATR